MRFQWQALVFETEIFEDGIYDPISGLENLRGASEGWGRDVWCAACAETHRKDWQRARQKVWNYLDAWLELPSETKE